MTARTVKRAGFLAAGIVLGCWLGWRGVAGEAAAVTAWWIDGRV